MGSPLDSAERRWGFRVVIADLPEALQGQTRVEVDYNGKTSTATLVDLSLTGMLIDLDVDLDIEIGDHATTTIECAGRAVKLEGAIVRTIERGVVGIHFPESIKDGEFDPPTALAAVHRRLERAWLRVRTDAQYDSEQEED